MVGQGAVPEDQGRLFYGMVAPFANYSVAGWTWCECAAAVPADLPPAPCPLHPCPEGCCLCFGSLTSAAVAPSADQGENNVYGVSAHCLQSQVAKALGRLLLHWPWQCVLRHTRAGIAQDMGNSMDGTGYGCSLPAMIDLWRRVWTTSR